MAILACRKDMKTLGKDSKKPELPVQKVEEGSVNVEMVERKEGEKMNDGESTSPIVDKAEESVEMKEAVSTDGVSDL